jgi:hypothetical protein
MDFLALEATERNKKNEMKNRRNLNTLKKTKEESKTTGLALASMNEMKCVQAQIQLLCKRNEILEKELGKIKHDTKMNSANVWNVLADTGLVPDESGESSGTVTPLKKRLPTSKRLNGHYETVYDPNTDAGTDVKAKRWTRRPKALDVDGNAIELWYPSSYSDTKKIGFLDEKHEMSEQMVETIFNFAFTGSGHTSSLTKGFGMRLKDTTCASGGMGVEPPGLSTFNVNRFLRSPSSVGDADPNDAGVQFGLKRFIDEVLPSSAGYDTSILGTVDPVWSVTDAANYCRIGYLWNDVRWAVATIRWAWDDYQHRYPNSTFYEYKGITPSGVGNMGAIEFVHGMLDVTMSNLEAVRTGQNKHQSKSFDSWFTREARSNKKKVLGFARSLLKKMMYLLRASSFQPALTVENFMAHLDITFMDTSNIWMKSLFAATSLLGYNERAPYTPQELAMNWESLAGYIMHYIISGNLSIYWPLSENDKWDEMEGDSYPPTATGNPSKHSENPIIGSGSRGMHNTGAGFNNDSDFYRPMMKPMGVATMSVVGNGYTRELLWSKSSYQHTMTGSVGNAPDFESVGHLTAERDGASTDVFFSAPIANAEGIAIVAWADSTSNLGTYIANDPVSANYRPHYIVCMRGTNFETAEDWKENIAFLKEGSNSKHKEREFQLYSATVKHWLRSVISHSVEAETHMVDHVYNYNGYFSYHGTKRTDTGGEIVIDNVDHWHNNVLGQHLGNHIRSIYRSFPVAIGHSRGGGGAITTVNQFFKTYNTPLAESRNRSDNDDWQKLFKFSVLETDILNLVMCYRSILSISLNPAIFTSVIADEGFGTRHGKQGTVVGVFDHVDANGHKSLNVAHNGTLAEDELKDKGDGTIVGTRKLLQHVIYRTSGDVVSLLGVTEKHNIVTGGGEYCDSNLLVLVIPERKIHSMVNNTLANKVSGAIIKIFNSVNVQDKMNAASGGLTGDPTSAGHLANDFLDVGHDGLRVVASHGLHQFYPWKTHGATDFDANTGKMAGKVAYGTLERVENMKLPIYGYNWDSNEGGVYQLSGDTAVTNGYTLNSGQTWMNEDDREYLADRVMKRIASIHKALSSAAYYQGLAHVAAWCRNRQGSAFMEYLMSFMNGRDSNALGSMPDTITTLFNDGIKTASDYVKYIQLLSENPELIEQVIEGTGFTLRSPVTLAYISGGGRFTHAELQGLVNNLPQLDSTSQVPAERIFEYLGKSYDLGAEHTLTADGILIAAEDAGKIVMSEGTPPRFFKIVYNLKGDASSLANLSVAERTVALSNMSPEARVAALAAEDDLAEFIGSAVKPKDECTVIMEQIEILKTEWEAEVSALEAQGQTGVRTTESLLAKTVPTLPNDPYALSGKSVAVLTDDLGKIAISRNLVETIRVQIIQAMDAISDLTLSMKLFMEADLANVMMQRASGVASRVGAYLGSAEFMSAMKNPTFAMAGGITASLMGADDPVGIGVGAASGVILGEMSIITLDVASSAVAAANVFLEQGMAAAADALIASAKTSIVATLGAECPAILALVVADTTTAMGTEALIDATFESIGWEGPRGERKVYGTEALASESIKNVLETGARTAVSLATFNKVYGAADLYMSETMGGEAAVSVGEAGLVGAEDVTEAAIDSVVASVEKTIETEVVSEGMATAAPVSAEVAVNTAGDAVLTGGAAGAGAMEVATDAAAGAGTAATYMADMAGLASAYWEASVALGPEGWVAVGVISAMAAAATLAFYLTGAYDKDKSTLKRIVRQEVSKSSYIASETDKLSGITSRTEKTYSKLGANLVGPLRNAKQSREMRKRVRGRQIVHAGGSFDFTISNAQLKNVLGEDEWNRRENLFV